MGCYSITELASAFNLQVQVPIYTVTWVEHLTQEHHTMTPPWPGLEPGQLDLESIREPHLKPYRLSSINIIKEKG